MGALQGARSMGALPGAPIKGRLAGHPVNAVPCRAPSAGHLARRPVNGCLAGHPLMAALQCTPIKGRLAGRHNQWGVLHGAHRMVTLHPHLLDTVCHHDGKLCPVVGPTCQCVADAVPEHCWTQWHLHQLRHQELQKATREAMLLIVFMTDHFMDLTCFKTNHALSLRPDTAPEPAPGPRRNH